MNIKTFEQQFNKTILKRGYQYYINDHVEDLTRIDATNWQAEVNGTYTYVVDVQMNANGDIVYTDCDCPYDDDCKHIAAVLYEIRDHQLTAPVQTTPAKKTSLRELLQAQTKERLIELITSVGQNHPGFLHELELLLATPANTLEAAEELITHYIYEALDHKGHIPWHGNHKGMQGIYTVHEQIAEQINDQDYITAIQFSLLCFRHALAILEMGDDHDGNFGYSLEESTGFIEQAVWEGVDNWDEVQCEKVYELIMKDALNPKLQGWSEYRTPLLQTCIPLCQNDAIEERFLETLHSLKSTTNDWNSNYHNSQLRELQLQLITSKHGKQQADAFSEQNIDDANMREQLILSAIKRKDFEKVLRLALDGITQDHDKPGTVNKWKRFAYKANKKLGNKENMRKVAFELLQDGDYEYYGELRLLNTKESWPATLEELLDALQKNGSPHYAKILIQEKQPKRILDYCQQQPSRIEQYYPHLKEHYYEDVCALFIDTITTQAANATNRKRHQEVSHTIKTMQKAGYTFEAKQLIADLIETYPKRRAFVEELQKLT